MAIGVGNWHARGYLGKSVPAVGSVTFEKDGQLLVS